MNETSQKSKDVAELISKKQIFRVKSGSEGIGIVLSTSTCNLNTSTESDDECLPADDDEDPANINQFLQSMSRSKQYIKKIVDDSDYCVYQERQNKFDIAKAAASGKYDGSCLSAAIEYVLDGYSISIENWYSIEGLEIPNYIWNQLHIFQRETIEWLWHPEQDETRISGGILADESGFGKTVQMIAYITAMKHPDLVYFDYNFESINFACIFVIPTTAIYYWVSHFHYWEPKLRLGVLHHSDTRNHSEINKTINDIHSSHGILITTYDGLSKYANDFLPLYWKCIIVKESQRMKNIDEVSVVLRKFTTSQRMLIMAPIEQSVQNLWHLFNFVRYGLLGTYEVFMKHCGQPIIQGGAVNATQFQETLALEIAKQLSKLIAPWVLRRTRSIFEEDSDMPEVQEKALYCALTSEQSDLYTGYLTSRTVKNILDEDNKNVESLNETVIVALSTLRKICNHPDLYLYEAYEDVKALDKENFGHWKRSGKMTVLHSLLKLWQKQGHRTLIITHSRPMLYILEQYLQNQKTKYLSMDGSVLVSQRQHLVRTFNENSKYLVFLATTKVRGFGINLVGADKMIIYDPEWNSAADGHANDLTWKIGKEKNITVYKLISVGTIEEKLYVKPIFKKSLSNKDLIDPELLSMPSTLRILFHLENPNYGVDIKYDSLLRHTKVEIKSENDINNDQDEKSEDCKKPKYENDDKYASLLRHMKVEIKSENDTNNHQDVKSEDCEKPKYEDDNKYASLLRHIKLEVKSENDTNNDQDENTENYEKLQYEGETKYAFPMRITKVDVKSENDSNNDQDEKTDDNKKIKYKGDIKYAFPMIHTTNNHQDVKSEDCEKPNYKDGNKYDSLLRHIKLDVKRENDTNNDQDENKEDYEKLMYEGDIKNAFPLRHTKVEDKSETNNDQDIHSEACEKTKYECANNYASISRHIKVEGKCENYTNIDQDEKSGDYEKPKYESDSKYAVPIRHTKVKVKNENDTENDRRNSKSCENTKFEGDNKYASLLRHTKAEIKSENFIDNEQDVKSEDCGLIMKQTITKTTGRADYKPKNDTNITETDRHKVWDVKLEEFELVVEQTGTSIPERIENNKIQHSTASLEDDTKSKDNQRKTRKRRYSISEIEVENLVAIKKENREIEKEESIEDYIVRRLFPKSSIKDAFQYQEVEGFEDMLKQTSFRIYDFDYISYDRNPADLSKKDKRDIINEVAGRIAKAAINAIRPDLKKPSIIIDYSEYI